MKILITTFTYLPNMDGVSEACRVLAEGLESMGWEVWVATSMGIKESEMKPKTILINGVHVCHFCFVNKSTDFKQLVPSLAEFKKFINTGDFDIVVNQCWDTRISIATQSLFSGIRAKRVLMSHGYGGLVYFWYPKITMGLVSWFRRIRFTLVRLPSMIRAYDHLVFLSARKDFRNFFDHKLASLMKHPSIEIIANGVDLDRFTNNTGNFRKTHGIGNAPMALCVANYSAGKNQRLTIDSFRKANVPGSVLVCIGSLLNDYGKSVAILDRKLAMTHSDCKVILLENLSREETISALNACDLFLLTSKAETQPIVLIEAMAASKPWISTNIGCVKEMKGGRVVDSKREIVSSIRQLLNDPALREQLGAEGRKDAEHRYDARANVQRFDELLKGFIKN